MIKIKLGKQSGRIGNLKTGFCFSILSLSFLLMPPTYAEKLNPFEGNPAAIERGKSIFQGVCVRCHGINGVTPFKIRDLRRLNKKYKKWNKDPDKIFFETITNGRAAKGMPAFTDQYTDEEKWKIKTYLNTIQTL